MFEKLTNKITEKINNYKEQDAKFKELLQTTTTFNNLNKIETITKEESTHKINFITNNCPDINDYKAKIITQLIPIEETILETFYAKEILTNKEFFIVPTNKNLWIITETEYITLSLDQKISIIKNNFMSKTILLNNILLEINGTNDKINILINILTNVEERNKIILEKTKYLCGIIPIYQKINSINSGISIDKENNIVIHTKEANYKYNIMQITDYEILLDNQIYYSKNSYSKTFIGTSKSSCLTMTIKLTIDNNIIKIPILETNSFGNKYESTGTTYQNNLNFAKTIIEKIESYIQ